MVNFSLFFLFVFFSLVLVRGMMVVIVYLIFDEERRYSDLLTSMAEGQLGFAHLQIFLHLSTFLHNTGTDVHTIYRQWVSSSCQSLLETIHKGRWSGSVQHIEGKEMFSEATKNN